MKYDVKHAIKINQAKVVEAGFTCLGRNTDLVDWAIIDYIGALAASPAAKRQGDLVWMNYGEFIQRMPLLCLNNKQAVSKRITKLKNLGLIRAERSVCERRVYVGLTGVSAPIAISSHT